ncbi:glucose 1-dehydrogenase (plasmid) [Deinococcus radiomollis]|uniref:glucose 1-dehydrogenase n=1 Tax=Deinococcus radiomollis TaxID=468916 RepID=UPI0038926FCE
MQIELTGKRVLVTGANSGIGAAVAREFASSGARVAINYVTHPEAADAVVAELQAAGAEAVALQADVSDKGQVEAMFARLDTLWGGIDVLVNNAGIDGSSAPGWQADPQKWRSVIDINLMGAFFCAQAALARMVAQKSGVVLNMTSVHEIVAWSGFSAYTASKAGLSMLTKTLAQEAGPFGVRVLSVAPGAMKTPINASVWNDPQGLADLLTKIPLGRMGLPEDVAHLAVFLASDLASYMTGSTVFVDGGMTDYPSFMHGG